MHKAQVIEFSFLSEIWWNGCSPEHAGLFADIVAACLRTEPDARPTAAQVLQWIEDVSALPENAAVLDASEDDSLEGSACRHDATSSMDGCSSSRNAQEDRLPGWRISPDRLTISTRPDGTYCKIDSASEHDVSLALSKKASSAD